MDPQNVVSIIAALTAFVAAITALFQTLGIRVKLAQIHEQTNGALQGVIANNNELIKQRTAAIAVEAPHEKPAIS